MQIAGVELEDLAFDKIGNWPIGIRIALIMGMGLTLLLLGVWFDLKGAYAEYSRIKTERAQFQISFAKACDQASNLEVYKKQVFEVEKSLLSLEKQLPKSSEEALVLEELSRQAISSGLVFLSFKPEPLELKEFYKEQTIAILLTGGYHGFGEFTSRIAAMPRIVTVHDFSLRAKPNHPKQLDIAVSIKTYWTNLCDDKI